MKPLRDLFLKKSVPESQEKVQQVYAFVALFAPGTIVGLFQNDEWYLPGGLLVGKNAPARKGEGYDADVAQMAGFVREQTGLRLLGLANPLSITLHPTSSGLAACVLYAAQAIGHIERASILDPGQLPPFARICGDPAPQIHRILEKEKLSRQSLDRARTLDGIFVTAYPNGFNQQNIPCHYLLRFYPDGLVLQTGICSADLVREWPTISEWFHRDSDRDLGRGSYVLANNYVSFTTNVHFRQLDHHVTMDFKGLYESDSLLLETYSHTTQARGLVKFTPFPLSVISPDSHWSKN